MTNAIASQLARMKALPARPFAFPNEMIDDPSFNLDEKREILCEWASVRCAVESFPTLRWLPGATFPVTFSAVMEALAQLDRLGERRLMPSVPIGRRTPVWFPPSGIARRPDWTLCPPDAPEAMHAQMTGRYDLCCI